MTPDSMPILSESDPLECMRLFARDEDEDKLKATSAPESLRADNQVAQSEERSESDRPALKMKITLSGTKDSKENARQVAKEDGRVTLTRGSSDTSDLESNSITVQDREARVSKCENSPEAAHERSKRKKKSERDPRRSQTKRKKSRDEREAERRMDDEYYRNCENQAVARRIAMEFENTRRLKVLHQMRKSKENQTVEVPPKEPEVNSVEHPAHPVADPTLAESSIQSGGTTTSLPGGDLVETAIELPKTEKLLEDSDSPASEARREIHIPVHYAVGNSQFSTILPVCTLPLAAKRPTGGSETINLLPDTNLTKQLISPNDDVQTSSLRVDSVVPLQFRTTSVRWESKPVVSSPVPLTKSATDSHERITILQYNTTLDAIMLAAEQEDLARTTPPDEKIVQPMEALTQLTDKYNPKKCCFSVDNLTRIDPVGKSNAHMEGSREKACVQASVIQGMTIPRTNNSDIPRSLCPGASYAAAPHGIPIAPSTHVVDLRCQSYYKRVAAGQEFLGGAICQGIHPLDPRRLPTSDSMEGKCLSTERNRGVRLAEFEFARPQPYPKKMKPRFRGIYPDQTLLIDLTPPDRGALDRGSMESAAQTQENASHSDSTPNGTGGELSLPEKRKPEDVAPDFVTSTIEKISPISSDVVERPDGCHILESCLTGQLSDQKNNALNEGRDEPENRADLEKLKQILASLQKFAVTISSEVSKAVYLNIFNLVSGTSSVESFAAKTQRATKRRLKSHILPFLAKNLALIQKDILVSASRARTSSDKYMRSNPECLIDPKIDVKIEESGGIFEEESVDEKKVKRDPEVGSTESICLPNVSSPAVSISEVSEESSPPSRELQIGIQKDLIFIQKMLSRISNMVESTKEAIKKLKDEPESATVAIFPSPPRTLVLNMRSPSPDSSPKSVGTAEALPQKKLELSTPVPPHPASTLSTSPGAVRTGIIVKAYPRETPPQTEIERFEGTMKQCWNCGRTAGETCGGCKLAKYCSRFCQHKDWESHFRVCTTTARRKIAIN